MSIYRHFTTIVLSFLISLLLGGSLAQANDRGAFQDNRFVVYVDTVVGTFNVNDPPRPLDTVIFSRDVYEVDLSDPSNPVPTGPVIGSNMVQCTVAGPAGFLCHGTLTLFGIGDLTLAGPFAFQNPSQASITGGSGRFAGARGQITALELPADADQVYWVDLSGRRQ